MIRGILEPVDGDEIANKKDREHHNFVTKSSTFAGEHFQLNQQELDAANGRLEEMDRVGESTKFVSLRDSLTKLAVERVQPSHWRQVRVHPD